MSLTIKLELQLNVTFSKGAQKFLPFTIAQTESAVAPSPALGILNSEILAKKNVC